MGGDQLDYEDGPSLPATGLLDIKLHINSVISDAHCGARYGTADIRNYYLNSPMQKISYMRISTKYISEGIMTKYALHDKVHNCHIYVEIYKGLYRVKESGIIVFQLLKKLTLHGYSPMQYTHGMWKYDTLPTTFTLATYDFSIKYVNTKHLEQLVAVLRKKYLLSL